MVGQVNGNGTARWQLWVSLAGIGLVVFGAIMTLFWTANSANSKADALEVEVRELESRNRDDESQIKVLSANLIEIETQFRASDEIRNLMQANNLRTESLLWHKSFGVDYPLGNAYYPTIAQDQPSK